MKETVISISAEEQHALRWLRQAEKAVTASKKPDGLLLKIFGLLAAVFRLISDLFGGCEWYRMSEAVRCYRKAGHFFKFSKNWDQAGSAFVQAAMLSLKDNRKYEASSNFVEASDCFRKIDVRRAIDSLEQAVRIQEECGGFMIHVAAKYHVTLAELYQSHLCDTEKSMVHYAKAAECYPRDEDGKARDCLKKVAEYSIERNDYTKAAQIREQLAERTAEVGREYSACQEFLWAALCHLCIDPLNAQFAVVRYKEKFPPFGSSEGYKLIEKLVQCMENSDADGFAEAVKVHSLHWTLWIVLFGTGQKLLERAKECCGAIDLT